MFYVQILIDSIDGVREMWSSAAKTSRLTTTWRFVMPAPSLQDQESCHRVMVLWAGLCRLDPEVSGPPEEPVAIGYEQSQVKIDTG